MKKRNFLVAFCSILALSCVSLGGITAKTNASATTPTPTTFEMRYGASARTKKDDSGLRFQAIVDKTTADAVVADDARSFGMIIVPTDYITDEMTDFVPALEAVCAEKKTTITKIETNSEGTEIVPYLGEDGNYYFNGIIRVSYNNTNRDFTGIAYIKTTGDSVSYEYAEFACDKNANGEAIDGTESYLNSSRSIAEIASAALNETDPDYVVEGSRREVCVSYVNDALTRAAGQAQDTDIEGLFAINGNGELAPNGEETLALTTTADLRLNWSSSDDVVATVDGGKVTVGEYVGKATITASIGNGETTDFAATKDVTSKASTGTFKWTENSISTVASRYDAYAAQNANPAYLEQTEIEGVNVIEVKAGAKASQPTVLFNNADCFFNLSAGSVITFKVGLSAGFYSSGGFGGVAITYKDAPETPSGTPMSASTIAKFNEKLYVSATSESTDMTLNYAIATVNGVRQTLYKAALADTTGTSEIIWIDFSLSFPNSTAATLENLMITFASHNFDIRNDEQVESNKIYVSDITVTEKVDKTKLTYFGASLQGIDAIDGTYPAELSLVEFENEEVLKVEASELFKQSTSSNCLPGVQFGDNDYQLTEASEISFKIRISDNFVSKSDNAGIIITYEGVGANSTIGNYIASATNDCALITSKTQTINAVNRFNDGSKTPQYVLTVREAESATTNARQWVTITLKLASGNLKLSGLRILFNSAHSASTYIDSNGKDNYILIKDFTVK